MVFASDKPEAIMQGEQMALFIGEIVEMNEEVMVIIPSVVMMGTLPDEILEVERFYYYYGSDETPRIGDQIVAILLEVDLLDTTWIFKATSNDYKTLKLLSQDHNVVKRYQTYINDGSYFDAQDQLDIEQGTINKRDLKNLKVEESPTYKANPLIVLLMIIFLLIVSFALFSKKKRIL